jgi:hypothetical protein
MKRAAFDSDSPERHGLVMTPKGTQKVSIK